MRYLAFHPVLHAYLLFSERKAELLTAGQCGRLPSVTAQSLSGPGLRLCHLRLLAIRGVAAPAQQLVPSTSVRLLCAFFERVMGDRHNGGRYQCKLPAMAREVMGT